MREDWDAIVLGAGPAGAEAAMTAASFGFRVLLIDEEHAAGGQIYRAPDHEHGDKGEGRELRRRLGEADVVCAFEHRVWHITRDFEVHALGPDGPMRFRAPSLIVATGAIERHCPVPGWTLPGVIGLAAATILLKTHKVLPGRRVVVAGSGPLLPFVANEIRQLGGTVVRLVDAARRRDWVGVAPQVLYAPALAMRGAGWLARLAISGVPLRYGHGLREIAGDGKVERVTIGPLSPDWDQTEGASETVEADAVCIGYGLIPSNDVTRLLRADHEFDPDKGGWVVRTDAEGRTSVPGLYVCGDAAGVVGAAAAPLSARIAARALARDRGDSAVAGHDREAARARAALAGKTIFGRAMTKIATPRRGASNWAKDETLICRCEGVSKGAIEAAIREGCATLDDVKVATRCGMGSCGGRICAEPVGALIAVLTGAHRAEIGQATGRSPLRPVSIDQIVGDFDYSDIPFPEASPQ
ncbi:MAG: FAD-binding protein [Salinarimonadaceae bacterium]|nr:MAG: FAD-binding protein [Salinarimonadaceae bacterium]